MAVKDGRLLAQLGFGATARRRSKVDEEEVEEPDVEPANPTTPK